MTVGTNQLYMYFRGMRILSKKGRDYKEAVAQEATEQTNFEPLKGTLSVSIHHKWPTRHNRDIDGVKGLLDAMTGILWEDDGQIVELHLSKEYDKSHPGVTLSVQTIDDSLGMC